MPKVKIVNENKEIEVPAGANLRRSLLEADVLVHHDVGMPSGVAKYLNCHGLGSCGTCHVFVKKGMENLSSKGYWESGRLLVLLNSIGHEDEVRLSCQTQVNGDVEVETRPPLNLYGESFWQ